MALAVAEESKIKEELPRLELRVGFGYWQKVPKVLLTETGKVLVDTLAEFEDLRNFFLSSFLFSAFRVLFSDFDLERLSERFSIFWQDLYSSFSFSLRALFINFNSLC